MGTAARASGSAAARVQSRCRYGTASTSAPTASPSSALRESVANSTSRTRDQKRQRQPQPMAPLEPQVDRRQDEQRHEQHDPEMVRVARERVRPVDVRAPTAP